MFWVQAWKDPVGLGGAGGGTGRGLSLQALTILSRGFLCRRCLLARLSLVRFNFAITATATPPAAATRAARLQLLLRLRLQIQLLATTASP